MGSSSDLNEPRIVDYGPQRVVGLGRVCRSSEDCHNVWADENGFIKLAGEACGPYFGVCRCVAGAEPGAFEYIAAMPAAADAPVPDGLAEYALPAGQYAVFPVEALSEIGRVWGQTAEWLAAHPEWKGYCDGDPDGCGCVERPSFELYPPEFDGTNGLFVYIPVHPA